MKTFGERLRELREETDIGLRGFCLDIGMEPSRYSRMERGITPAPPDYAELEPIRKALRLSEGSDAWDEVLRLADLSHGAIQPRVMTDAEVAAKIPALMPRMGGQKMTDRDVEDLVRMIRREHEYAPGLKGAT